MPKTGSITKKVAQEILRSVPKDRRPAALCGLVGHTRMQEFCFGYFTCGRCGAQVGDTLCGVYDGAKTAVVRGHDCVVCRENAESLTWRDKMLMPKPEVWLSKVDDE